MRARVPVGRAAFAFSHRSAAGLRRRCGPGIPVLVHDVSGRARGLCVSAPARMVFAVRYRIDTLEFFFHSSISGLSMPLQDSGSGWVTTPVRLFHSRHHAGLSRRTTNPRPRTNIGDVIEERRGGRDQDLAQRAPRFQLPVLPNLLLGAYAISSVGRNLPEFRLIE